MDFMGFGYGSMHCFWPKYYWEASFVDLYNFTRIWFFVDDKVWGCGLLIKAE